MRLRARWTRATAGGWHIPAAGVLLNRDLPVNAATSTWRCNRAGFGARSIFSTSSK